MQKSTSPFETCKASIKSYPFMFPTKWKFQINVYTINGTGYEWDENGNLTTEYSDFIESDFDRQYKTSQPKITNNPIYADLLKKQEVGDAVTRDFYDLILKHADVLAEQKMFWIFQPNFSDLDHMIRHSSERYINAFNFPENINLEWAADLRLFLYECMRMMRNQYCYNDTWYDEKTKESHALCVKHLNRLENIMNIDSSAFSRMISKIVKDEKEDLK